MRSIRRHGCLMPGYLARVRGGTECRESSCCFFAEALDALADGMSLVRPWSASIGLFAYCSTMCSADGTKSSRTRGYTVIPRPASNSSTSRYDRPYRLAQQAQ